MSFATRLSVAACSGNETAASHASGPPVTRRGEFSSRETTVNGTGARNGRSISKRAGGAEDHRRERDRIDTEVEERAVGEQAPDLGDVRQEPRPHALHEEQDPSRAMVTGSAASRLFHRERLLHQNCPARVQCEYSGTVVQRMRRGGVDGLDVGGFAGAGADGGDAAGVGQAQVFGEGRGCR
jgi:hypothetical protein